MPNPSTHAETVPHPKTSPTTPSRLRGDRGAAATELAIVMPLLLLLVLSSVHLGLWFHARHLVNAAAQEGARAARSSEGTDADGEARAREMLGDHGGSSVTDATVTVSRANGTVTVTITGDAPPVVPGLTLGVSATSSSPVEEFRP